MFVSHCRDAGNRMLVPLQGQGSNSGPSDGASYCHDGCCISSFPLSAVSFCPDRLQTHSDLAPASQVLGLQA